MKKFLFIVSVLAMLTLSYSTVEACKISKKIPMCPKIIIVTPTPKPIPVIPTPVPTPEVIPTPVPTPEVIPTPVPTPVITPMPTITPVPWEPESLPKTGDTGISIRFLYYAISMILTFSGSLILIFKKFTI